MARLLCAFDLDNTLYDFVGFFGPAYRGMLHALSKRSGLSYSVNNIRDKQEHARSAHDRAHERAEPMAAVRLLDPEVRDHGD